MKIQIYGSGCAKCKQLYANTETAVKSAGVEAEIEKVTDMDAIVDAGIMMTPALAVDGKVVASGKVLSAAEIVPLLGGEGEAPAEQPCGCGSSCSCGGAKKNSSAKRIVTVLLLLFVLASIAWVVYRESAAKNAALAAPAPVTDKVLTVFYFHGTQRCMTCNRIEELARQAVESKFSAGLKAGNIVFRSVNVDDPANEHFIRDFALDSKIVVMQKGDQIEKCPEVWQLVHDPKKFTAYIQSSVEKLK